MTKITQDEFLDRIMTNDSSIQEAFTIDGLKALHGSLYDFYSQTLAKEFDAGMSFATILIKPAKQPAVLQVGSEILSILTSRFLMCFGNASSATTSVLKLFVKHSQLTA
jgi:hypothetical protein